MDTPEQTPAESDLNTQELLQDLDGDGWAKTATPPLTSSPRKDLEDFKEELWDTVVKFGEPVMMGTGLDEKAREELSSKIIKLSGEKRKAKDDARKDSSTPNKKTDDKMIKIEGDYRIETINMI